MINQNIRISFDLDTQKLRREVDSTKDGIQRSLSNIQLDVDVSRAKNSISSLSGVFTGVAAGISATLSSAIISGVSSAANKIGNLLSDSVKLAFNKEGLTTSLTTSLNGNIQQAKELYSWSQKLADITPFSTETITKGMNSLISVAGLKPEDAKKTIKGLLNAAVVANPLNPNQGAEELTMAYSKGAAGGQFYTEDINKFADRGIRIWQALADVLGVNIQQVKKLASEGKITTEVFDAGLQKLNASGGQLNGQMEALGKTSIGIASTMSDAMDNVKVQAGEALQPAINAGMLLITDVFTQIKDSGVFDELNTSAQEFASYLKENPQLVQQLSYSLSELVKGGLELATDLAKSLVEWLSKPDTIKNLIQGVRDLNTALGYTVNAVKFIISGMGTMVDTAASLFAPVNALVFVFRNLSGFVSSIAEKLGLIRKEVDGLNNTKSTEYYSGADPNQRTQGGGTDNPNRFTRNDEIILAGVTLGEGKGTNVAVVNRANQNYGEYGTSIFSQVTAKDQFVAFDKFNKSSEEAFIKDLYKYYGSDAINKAIEDNRKNWEKDRAAIGNRMSFRTQGTVSGNITNYGGNSYLNEPQWDGKYRRNGQTPTTAGSPSQTVNLPPTITGTLDASGENGGDFPVGPNGEIRSYHSGVVTAKGNAGNMGNYIVIRFTGQDGVEYEANYSHIGSGLKLGSVVKKGQVIGKFDGSGRTNGAHNSIDITDIALNGSTLARSAQSPGARAEADAMVKGYRGVVAEAVKADKEAEAARKRAEEVRKQETKALYEKQDAELANKRAKRDSELSQAFGSEESKSILDYLNKKNAISDKYEDIRRVNERAIRDLEEDSKQNKDLKKANDTRIAALNEETRTAKIKYDSELQSLTQQFDKEVEKQLKSEQLKTLKAKQESDNLDLAASIAAETDVNKKAALEYQKQQSSIKSKYDEERAGILIEIESLEKLIKDYEKAGLDASKLRQLKSEKDKRLGFLRNSQFAEQSIADSGQRDRGIAFLNEVNSSYGSSVGSYLQRTDTEGYNAFMRNRGRDEINRQTQARLTAAQSLYQTGGLSAEELSRVNQEIQEMANADLSNLNNQFQTLGQTITTSVVQGLGEAFMSIIDGSKKAGEAMMDFLKKIASQLLNMAMNQLITKLLGGLFGGGGGVFGAATTGLSSLTGLFGGGGATVSGVAGLFGSGMSIPGFAEGGIINKPTMAMIGEGGYSEAVIPLKGGNVPVQLNGSRNTMGNISNNITVNVSSNGTSQIKYGGSDRLAKDLANVVDQRVRWHKNNPGGYLYN